MHAVVSTVVSAQLYGRGLTTVLSLSFVLCLCLCLCPSVVRSEVSLSKNYCTPSELVECAHAALCKSLKFTFLFLLHLLIGGTALTADAAKFKIMISICSVAISTHQPDKNFW